MAQASPLSSSRTFQHPEREPRTHEAVPVWICRFWLRPIHGITSYGLFCDWFLSLTVVFVRPIHMVASLHTWLHWKDAPSFVCPSAVGRVGMFPPLALVHRAALYVCTFLFDYLVLILGGVSLEVELMSHVAALCLPFWGACRLFPRGCTLLGSHQQHTGVPRSPIPAILVHVCEAFATFFLRTVSLTVSVPTCSFRAQIVPSPPRLFWPIDYFDLKALEKQWMQAGLPDLLLST